MCDYLRPPRRVIVTPAYQGETIPNGTPQKGRWFIMDPMEFGLGDFHFSWGDHICAIFETHAEQMGIMGSFMSAGIQAEQRCVWVAPEDSANALRQTLADMGGDLPSLEASGQLLIISDIDFYLNEGVFDPDRTIGLISTLLQDNEREGYSTMRLGVDVSHHLSSERVDPDAWERFERQLTYEIAPLPMVMVCQYDRRQVSGAMIVIAMRTHRIVILGEDIHHNPFFVEATAPGGARPEIV